MTDFNFIVIHHDSTSGARIGQIHTPHGIIHTPAFVPVGTQASVKSLTPDELKSLGVQLFFVNTYHMAMRPGIEIVEKAGGLHSFMNWNGPLITDSGGFQVFSLGAKRVAANILQSDAVRQVELVKISEKGVEFLSHWDGTKHLFTPEISMQYQWRLGSDIHIAFDECTPYPISYAGAKKSMEQTHRWGKRSLEEHRKKSQKSKVKVQKYQALYGVVQGSVFEDLRRKSADFIAGQDFDGIAIGGVAVGESKVEMRQICDWVIPRLPKDKPRHLLGVGEIDDIFDIVERGVDTFDCVQPTRLARMGHAFASSKLKVQSSKWTIDINNHMYAQDFSQICAKCDCYTCGNFTRAYLHHLFRVKELLVYRLLTLHNVHFVLSLVQTIRKRIADGSFTRFKNEFLKSH